MDDLLLLDSLFNYRDFNNIAIKQNRGLINIKINTTYTNVADADYCKIDDIGYWVTGIRMLNDNVAELILEQDYLTTIGINNFSIVSGWCTRKCVTDDTIFTNVIPENFVPMEELIVEGCDEIKMHYTNSPSDPDYYTEPSGHLNVLVSSIDLNNLQNLADVYDDNHGNEILVPTLPLLPSQVTTYSFHPEGAVYGVNTDIPLTAAYNPSANNILDAVNKVRSLGIESCINASYNIPNKWINGTPTETNGMYDNLSDNHGIAPSKFSPDQYNTLGDNYKNNKVYSGQFQKIVIYSLCSGDRQEFKVEDILNVSDGHIDWYYFADLRYNGFPAVKPWTYKKQEFNSSMFGVIKGAGWQNTPFMYSQASGYDILDSSIRYNQKKSFDNMLASGADWGVGALKSAVTLGMSDFSVAMPTEITDASAEQYYNNLSSARSAQNSAYNSAIRSSMPSGGVFGRIQGTINQYRDYNRLYTDSMVVHPNIEFPMIPQLQDFIGNKFYEMRYRLSDNDMQRFDKYLTMYGYAVYEEMTMDAFTGRDKFNFVMGNDVVIKSTYPLYMRQGVMDLIQRGVRVWHVAPSLSAFDNNPITPVTP